MTEAIYLDRAAVLRNYRARLLRELAEVDLLIAGAEAEQELARESPPARQEAALAG